MYIYIYIYSFILTKTTNKFLKRPNKFPTMLSSLKFLRDKYLVFTDNFHIDIFCKNKKESA